jgi:hypothetical protein
MKLHVCKDYVAVFLATLGILLISFDKCYVENKSVFYRIFLSVIVLIDSYFLLKPKAYRDSFGYNTSTYVFLGLLCLPFVSMSFYVVSCIK